MLRFTITLWILANSITGNPIVSDDERSNGAESNTDYNNLDIGVTVLAANDFDDDDHSNRNGGVDNN